MVSIYSLKWLTVSVKGDRTCCEEEGEASGFVHERKGTLALELWYLWWPVGGNCIEMWDYMYCARDARAGTIWFSPNLILLCFFEVPIQFKSLIYFFNLIYIIFWEFYDLNWSRQESGYSRKQGKHWDWHAGDRPQARPRTRGHLHPDISDFYDL